MAEDISNELKILARYIHGSEDSTDTDVVYVVEQLPDKIKCKQICSGNPDENRNLIVIKDGIVTESYKGTPDEINNALMTTYVLHQQDYPLLVTQKVKRIAPLKYVRGIRIILSHLSRSQYRESVKKALHGDWQSRLDVLYDIDPTTIDFSTLNKKMSREDILKTIAFQLAQMCGLMYGCEIYTKRFAAVEYPELKPFLYREKDTDIEKLWTLLRNCIDTLKWEIGYYKIDKVTGRETTVRIPNGQKTFCDIDLITEQLIDIDNNVENNHQL